MRHPLLRWGGRRAVQPGVILRLRRRVRPDPGGRREVQRMSGRPNALRTTESTIADRPPYERCPCPLFPRARCLPPLAPQSCWPAPMQSRQHNPFETVRSRRWSVAPAAEAGAYVAALPTVIYGRLAFRAKAARSAAGGGESLSSPLSGAFNRGPATPHLPA